LLPSYAEEPVGGFKVVYEYAAGLARRGHQVTLLHPGALERPTTWQGRLAVWKWWVRRHLRKKPWAPWFVFPKGVRFRVIPWYTPTALPKTGVILATAWQTAPIVAQASQGTSRGLYLVQHFEDWSGDAQTIEATFRLPLRILTISGWLQERIAQAGGKAEILRNRIDLSEFGIDTPPEVRDPNTILVLVHALAWKGTADALEALRLVATQRAIRPILFGTHHLPNLPADMPFVCAPHGTALRALYNQASIFLAPSHSEGWGLPPCEAMACGAAVVATDIGGHREFCVSDKNCLLVSPKNPEQMAEAIGRLLDEPPLRMQLAYAGAQSIRSFDTEDSLLRLEQILREQSHA
jgi:glycosyltransferase involved in cell wall biosynthesis